MSFQKSSKKIIGIWKNPLNIFNFDLSWNEARNYCEVDVTSKIF